VRAHAGLQARPLVSPEVHTAVGWLTSGNAPASQAVKAALAWAQDSRWQTDLDAHTGSLLLA